MICMNAQIFNIFLIKIYINFDALKFYHFSVCIETDIIYL